MINSAGDENIEHQADDRLKFVNIFSHLPCKRYCSDEKYQMSDINNVPWAGVEKPSIKDNAA